MVNYMKYITDINLENKKVLLRVDYNVPIEGTIIMDNNRIKQSLETINYLLDKNCKIILLSHLGKVKTEEDKIKNDMKYVVDELSGLLNKEILFSSVTRGTELEEKVSSMKERDILLVQNTRYEDYPNKLESSCDDELSRYWASFADVYIMDAFGSAHRKHASTYGVALYLETGIGFLMKKEMQLLDEVKSNEGKIIVLGGSKADDKIKMMSSLLPSSKYALIGGLMSMPFLTATGKKTGANEADEISVKEAINLLNQYRDKIVLPSDLVVSTSLESTVTIRDVDYILNDEFCYDIGPKTIENFKDKLYSSTLIFWNGPLGLFENIKFENGTKSLLELLSDFNAKVVLAGGDISSAASKYGLEHNFTISTGGGASLEYLGNSNFPILELIKSKNNNV